MTPTPRSPHPSPSEPAAEICLIAAVAANGVIGAANALPWHLPADLRRFKELTWGHPVIMGRNTWDSLPARFRPLPGRTNIVVSRDPGFLPQGVVLARSLEEALAAGARESAPLFVIGGAALYAQAIGRAARIYLTQLHFEVAGDAFFPPLDPRQWRETTREEHPAAEGRPAYAFVTLARRAAGG